jgi:hypothetical protein
MDKQRKLYLMNKYDFHGFGNARAALEAWMDMFVYNNIPQKDKGKFIKKLRDAYKQLRAWYSQIKFDELEKEIGEEDQEDFATLFTTKTILDRLEEPLEKFISLVQNSNTPVERYNPVFQIPYQMQRDIVSADKHLGIAYRTRINRLESEIKKIK